jgi:hypothetical protein
MSMIGAFAFINTIKLIIALNAILAYVEFIRTTRGRPATKISYESTK